jgi:hypothetical protein
MICYETSDNWIENERWDEMRWVEMSRDERWDEKVTLNLNFVIKLGKSNIIQAPDIEHKDIYSVRVYPHLVALNESYYTDKINLCEYNLKNVRKHSL